MNLDEIVTVYSAGMCCYFIDKIESLPFISERFDAELAARIFFSDHSESQVTDKLNELANLQVRHEYARFILVRHIIII
jgi:hypothetical protein